MGVRGRLFISCTALCRSRSWHDQHQWCGMLREVFPCCVQGITRNGSDTDFGIQVTPVSLREHSSPMSLHCSRDKQQLMDSCDVLISAKC